jgi:hypothetical protein
MSVGQELLNAPFPELVLRLGISIAEAQYSLDQVSIRIAQQMAGFKLNGVGELVPDEKALVLLKEGDPKVSLLALGFTPTFYQFVETHIDFKMAISMKTSTETSVGASAGVSFFTLVSASVNASYTQKYQYETSGSTQMRTKLVTVPSPAVFEQRLKQLVDSETPEP